MVGGTNVLTNPDVSAGLDRGHFLSRTRNCKSFDDRADRYCRGKGVGIVILKRLEDAQADNDLVYSCILAAATNHSVEAPRWSIAGTVFQNPGRRRCSSQ